MSRRPSFFHQLRERVRRSWTWVAPVLRTPHLWLGLVIGIAGLAALYLAFNHVVMPNYTRQNAEVVVPELRHLNYSDAVQMVERRRLRPERREQPFNPSFARETILDQNPAPSALVKPGRRVYLYVNSGTERTVTMPEVRTVTESVARAELAELGLVRIDVKIDERPSPFAGTVTRQEPEAGETVRTSEGVTLWVSPGLSDRTVEVPDVRGYAQADAAEVLREAGLWVDPTRLVTGTITRQEPAAGSMVRVGSEVRISSIPIEEDEELPGPPDDYVEYEEGIPPFIEEPPEGEPPAADEPRRDPDRIDW